MTTQRNSKITLSQSSEKNESRSTALYRQLTPHYREYSLQKSNYISAVNEQVIKHLNKCKSLLDLGTGDGIRIQNILNQTKEKIDIVFLVDNCKEILTSTKLSSRLKCFCMDISEQHFDLQRKFDVITCLWNVLGHIEKKYLLQTLKNMKKHLNKNGVVILDVNNRYNIKQYKQKALKNMCIDILRPWHKTGDIFYTMHIDGQDIPAFGHVFSKKEIETWINKAGFNIQETLYINYQTGEQERSQFSGQLFYVLKPYH